MIGGRTPAEAGNLSPHYRVRTVFGAYPASCPMGTWGSITGGNAAGGDADYSPPSIAEVKNAWSYTSSPSIRLHGVVLG